MAHQPHAGSRSEGQGAPLSGGVETIAAIATPAGRGGIGVVRVAGLRARDIAGGILGRVPEPRIASLLDFRADDGAVLDRGLALFFPAPHSYTGDDVLELQGHGGPVVLQQLLRRCIALGARMARPGEFTQRAFLNDRIDLAQAEGVADLIDASSAQAARSAARSLTGEFSRRVDALVASVGELRMHVEACIDFPEEQIDPADIAAQRDKLDRARDQWRTLLAEARQGAVLREGLTVVLIGRPNVGKSSLLNALAGEDLAIVTPIAGTTRDSVRATLSLEGVPIHLIDTAGLREGGDEVERIGIARTWSAVEKAGAAIFIRDAADAPGADEQDILARLPAAIPIAQVQNKIDLQGDPPASKIGARGVELSLSAKTGAGVDLLRGWLLQTAGWLPHGEGVFMARERHLHALEEVGRYLGEAAASTQAFELFAENLRLAQRSLGSITGEVTADDLLGEIFSRFCIGK